ncbi:MAG: magnesium transporter CorA family protein [Atopobiaceae bacterium]|jgi:magnesium transporter|nr:magnesium transporter CorA family protein [Atopobiaceae bacterium]
MIEFYKTSIADVDPTQPRSQRLVTRKIDKPEPGCWISVVSPDADDRRWLQSELNIEPEFVQASLDDEETSHIDYDDETGQVLVIVDCPFVEDDRDAVDQSITQYDTHPLSLIFLPEQDVLVTVSLKESETVNTFSQGKFRGINTTLRTRMLLQMLLHISQRYLVCLRSINRQFRENERVLRKTMRNDELIKMLGFEKSLVYLSTSLKSTEATLNRIGYGRILHLYEDDRDLLDDVSIEMSQAIEMCSTYSNILNGTMDAFGNIINNNMNITMRTLAILTLVLSIPNMVYGFYGMNTPLPHDDTWVFAFALSVAATVGATVILMRSRFVR